MAARQLFEKWKRLPFRKFHQNVVSGKSLQHMKLVLSPHPQYDLSRRWERGRNNLWYAVESALLS